MYFTDTHCHIHEQAYAQSEEAYARSLASGVHRINCVGTDIKSSVEAVEFANSHERAWATIGIHPHEAQSQLTELSVLEQLLKENSQKIIGIGEIGLDYYYNHSPREVQIQALEAQLQIALGYDLPVSFHVRDAFEDFWPIFHNFSNISGVLHSFTDNLSNMEKGLKNELYVGINGIATFATDKQELYRVLPLSKMLFETDAPFLTPKPHRGKVNEPGFVVYIAQHIANLQGCELSEVSRQSEQNATDLFF